MRALLQILDGSHDHASLAVRLAKEALDGRLIFSRDGQALTEADSIKDAAKEHLSTLLDSLAKTSLLVG
jgi:hypothetical protein